MSLLNPPVNLNCVALTSWWDGGALQYIFQSTDVLAPGWDKSWIDVVEERIIKQEFKTSPDNVEKVVRHVEKTMPKHEPHGLHVRGCLVLRMWCASR